MKPSQALRRVILTLTFLTLERVLVFGNSPALNLLNPDSHVDYVIICPARYVNIMQPLADYRAARNGYNTAVITTEAIYQIFRQRTSADSAIREFISYSLTSWPSPKPQYFLLAGNINTVPSHKERGLWFYGEDSIVVDQWLVEGIQDTSLPRPAAAIGRFPGWNETDMQVLVNKTIQYEQMNDAPWMNRAIALADYNEEVGNSFEIDARSHLMKFANKWRDTASVHVRSDSPYHKTKREFIDIWNQGAAYIWFIGHINLFRYSRSNYFVASDIDSISNGSPLPMVRLQGGQRFERTDTIPIAVRLLLTPGKGAICTLSPTGLAYLFAQFQLGQAVLDQLLRTPRLTIGKAIFNCKRLAVDEQDRKETLLGDPALTIRHALTAGGGTPGNFPESIQLYQNYPNPFNPSTIIRFDLPSNADVVLSVYNILGQQISTLVSGTKHAGSHTVTFDATGLTSGVYLCRLKADNVTLIRKMTVIK